MEEKIGGAATWLHFFGDGVLQDAESIKRSLVNAGVDAQPLASGTADCPGIVVFDAVSPDLCEFLRETSRNGAERVLAIALPDSTVDATELWALLDAGAADALLWDRVRDTASQIAARIERWHAVDSLLRSPVVTKNLIGGSPVWKTILRQIVEVARFTDASVLILGDTGTGKELVARLIHTLDARPTKRELVVVDCTTIVPELSGSEFFGHERGAFTGAVGPRDGAFTLANSGSLFLDEVGELPSALQAQLLRVTQETTYRRVGGNQWHRTEFRLIGATNRDLPQEVLQSRFRSDLYHRIAVCVCRLPPLSQRPDDILPLTSHFLAEHFPSEDPPPLDDGVRDHLLLRTYPGNVRELKQLVTRISQRHVGDGPITIGDLPEEEKSRHRSLTKDWPSESFENAVRHALTLGVGLKEIGQAATDAAIRIAVGDEAGNLQRAAQKLGVTDRALQMRRANRTNGR
jgi:transcriptional regulator with GAF, ATPase, and Fis domain